MVRPDTTKWDQTLDDLLHGSLHADHARTRERYLALYMIASGETNATQWAEKTGRCDETIMRWVHDYNELGPVSLTYRRTGGSRPLFRPSKPNESSEPSKPAHPRLKDCPDTAGH
jgi:hypothetical protein